MGPAVLKQKAFAVPQFFLLNYRCRGVGLTAILEDKRFDMWGANYDVGDGKLSQAAKAAF